jgi:hypothetical protein
MFVEDYDGLLGRVVQENGPKEVSVVREGDMGTLEVFGYARRDLTTVEDIAELNHADPHYVASLFTFDVSTSR